MPDNKLLSLAGGLRARAAEILLKIEAMTDADACRKCAKSLRATSDWRSGLKKRPTAQIVRRLLLSAPEAHTAAPA